MADVPVTVLAAHAAVAFDSLPVAQFQHFSDPLGSNWPFVQARFAALERTALLVQARIYEVGKPDDSRISITIGDLQIEASPTGHTVQHREAVSSSALAVRVTPVEGDDLQGEFWGIQLYIPEAVLQIGHPELTILAGQTLACQMERYTVDNPHDRAALFADADDGQIVLTAY